MFIIDMRGQAAVHGRRSYRRQKLLLLLPQMVAMQLFLVLLLQLVFTRSQRQVTVVGRPTGKWVRPKNNKM